MSRQIAEWKARIFGMLIRPAKCLQGEVVLPGDKSISHRAAIIAAIAEGESRIENYAASVDCAATLECLHKLGVEIRRDGNIVLVTGQGKHGLTAPTDPLDCGNSGTTMRLMAGLLAGQKFDSILIGDESLQRRPMKRVIEPLTAMGASIESDNGCAPLRVHGGRRLTAIEYTSEIASAQIKSCLLLAGLYAEGETSVIEPVPTRDHAERMLRKFGVPVDSENVGGSRFRHRVTSSSELRSRDITIPGDISAAAFFMIGAACLDGSDVRMRKVGRGAGRTAVLGILKNFGARLDVASKRETVRGQDGPIHEAVADIHIKGGFDSVLDKANRFNRLDGVMIPSLIDEIPILAILGTQLRDGLEIRDARELRVKESDRIAAVVENLRRMHAEVKEFDDGFRVGCSRLKGARVDSFGDHRIAMAFAIAGLLAEGETEIEGAECAAVSFPQFFEVLQSVVNY